MGPKQRAYDTVEVLGPPVRTITPEEFEKMPLDARVKLILSKQVRFLRAGKEVPTKEVLSGG